MFRDEKTGQDFAGSQNVWLKRLGLYIIIVAVFSSFFKAHIILFFVILFTILGLAILRYLGRGFIQFFKDLFFK